MRRRSLTDVVAGAAALVLLVACSNPVLPSASPGLSGARSSGEPALRLDGSGSGESGPFPVTGGDHTIEWTIETDAGDGCVHQQILLFAPDPAYRRDAGSSSLAGPGTKAGDALLEGLEPGTYYLEIDSDCANWTVAVATVPDAG